MQVIQPMLACPLDIEDIDRKANGFYMEPKLDGIRCLAAWDGRMISRSAKTDLASRLPHLSNAVRLLHLPQGVWLDGEVGYVTGWSRYSWPIFDFNATVRVTGSSVPEALAKQEHNSRHAGLGDIVFYVFDAVTESGLRVVPEIPEPQELGIWSIKMIMVAKDGWNEDVYNQYVLDGGEGVILKNPDAPYKPGKRPARTWYKIKKFHTSEGRIIGFDPGQGKYEGQIGALILQTAHGTKVRCSGMTDNLRLEMSLNWNQYVGRMVEFKFFGMVGAGGDGYRHPQFLRFRSNWYDE
jgi:ATP-dependent DNA ligase